MSGPSPLSIPLPVLGRATQVSEPKGEIRCKYQRNDRFVVLLQTPLILCRAGQQEHPTTPITSFTFFSSQVHSAYHPHSLPDNGQPLFILFPFATVLLTLYLDLLFIT